MKRRRRSSDIGRIKWKLWELLKAAGLSIPGPECFWMQEGAYRSADCARWGAHWEAILPNGTNPVNHRCYCWETMTECVKNGISIAKESSLEWQIHANEAD